jgi:uncharacterized protein (TIGR02300 family)
MTTARDLGTKYNCFKCGTKFYDMKKPVPACPKCGSDQRDSPALKAPAHPERRGKHAVAVAEPAEPFAEEPLPEEGEAAEEELAADEEEPAEDEPEGGSEPF